MEEDYYDLKSISLKLKISIRSLLKLSSRGEYPDILHPIRGKYLVLKEQHKQWEAGRWLSQLHLQQAVRKAKLVTLLPRLVIQRTE